MDQLVERGEGRLSHAFSLYLWLEREVRGQERFPLTDRWLPTLWGAKYVSS